MLCCLRYKPIHRPPQRNRVGIFIHITQTQNKLHRIRDTNRLLEGRMGSRLFQDLRHRV